MRLVYLTLALGGGAALMPQPQSAAATRAPLTAEQVRELGKASLCGGAKSAQDVAVASPSGAATTRPVLLPGYGEGGFPISGANAQAQAFFDNGLQLAHAFSHDEAVAAMRESVRLDPGCAMCLWGEAYATGPTINSDVNEAEAARLAGLIHRAQRLARNAPPRERALIAAMAGRYRNGGGGGAGDLAFARAMDAIAEAEPANDALQTLAADAWLVYAVHSDKEEHFARTKALLDRVLTRTPDYVPAIHYYIHVTEMMGNADLAERFANRLPVLAPAASHLVHMPSHTFYRIGRYQEAADVNKRAVEIGAEDTARLGQQPRAVWDQPYHAHNLHFGIGGALISGDGETALLLARQVRAEAGRVEGSAPVFLQMVTGTALFAEGRFGDTAAVLASDAPPEAWTYARSYWHYARGEAAARNSDVARIRAEIAAMPVLTESAETNRFERIAIRMAQISRLVLEGRAAMLEERPAAALTAFWRAAQLQEMPSFGAMMDPPIFWYPVRRDVAAALLKLGLHRVALQEADAVLRDWPREPMTLATRAAAREALGQTAAARTDLRAARLGWRGDPQALLR